MTRFSQPSFLNGPPQPLVLTMDGQGRTPFELYRLIAPPSQPSFLLESGKGTDSGARYSFLGSSPLSVLTGRQGQASFRTHEGRECSSKGPFDSLCRLFAGTQIETPPGLPNFWGGAVGYLSYDLVREFETLPSIAKDDLQLPHLQFGLYDMITAVDHQTDRLQIIFCPPVERFFGEPREKLYREGLDRLAEWEARLSGRPSPLNALPCLDQMAFHPDQTRDAYLQRVRDRKSVV